MVYVVERYLPGLTRSDLLRGLSRLEQLGSEGREVRYLGSTIVLADEACYCRFEGPTEAAIAEANRNAGLSYDRIVPALTVQPERRTTMNVSTTIPATVQIRRGQLFGLLVAVAVLTAAVTWALSTYTGGSSEQTQASLQAPAAVSSSPIPATGYLQAVTPVYSSPIPPTAYLDAVRSRAPQQDTVRAITAMTPVQLIEAFGTNVEAAAALAGLTSKERVHVESIMALTPAQLTAAFGTNVPADALAGLTPKERIHVESIMALTPAQLRAAFGTSSR